MGLEIASLVEEVEWAMEKLFHDDLIVEIESLLDWAWSGKGFDHSECYEDYEEGLKKGRVGFLWWPIGVDKEMYKEKEK